MRLEVTPGPRLSGPRAEAILRLLEEHLREMHALSPPGSVFALDRGALRTTGITMWSLWEDDILLGCGALKALGPGEGEIKSMRTDPAHRRRGVGRRILDAIIAEARQRRYSDLWLETGSTDDFRAAHSLYEGAGFERCGPFADYPDNPFSAFMRLRL